MIQKILILTFFAVLSGAACQTQKPSTGSVQSSNSPIGNSANTAAKSTASPQNSSDIPAQTLGFDVPDGAQIVGTFYAAAKENSPAVLMLHQYGSSRESYKDLAREFRASGFAVLAIDGRGFGDSTKKADGSRIAPSQSNEAVIGMKSDVAAAVKFLSEQKNVDKNRIGIIGASYGSSLAIIHAAENPDIKAVALLSPGTNYFGNLPTEPAVEKYAPRPVLIVAAEDDAESAAASRLLDKLATGDKHQLQIYPKGGHGTGVLNAGVGLDKLLLDFFSKEFVNSLRLLIGKKWLGLPRNFSV